MTNREVLTAIVNEDITEEVKAKAEEELAKLDARNAKRASTPSKKSVENEPIKAKIAEFLADGARLAKEIADGCEISTAKASALCRQMVEDGRLKVEDVKVKGKGTQKSYSLA
jgi:cell fate regulator YaaT (PSP1 superfamily)